MDDQYKVKITTHKGYDIYYIKGSKMFKAYDPNAEGGEVEVGGAVLQEDVERQIDAHIKANEKSKFKFPIPCIMTGYNGRAEHGSITSLNTTRRSVRITTTDRKGQKENHEHNWWSEKDDVFEVTPTNEVRVKQLAAMEVKKAQIDYDMREVTQGFEKPINRAYFGLPEERKRY